MDDDARRSRRLRGEITRARRGSPRRRTRARARGLRGRPTSGAAPPSPRHPRGCRRRRGNGASSHAAAADLVAGGAPRAAVPKPPPPPPPPRRRGRAPRAPDDPVADFERVARFVSNARLRAPPPPSPTPGGGAEYGGDFLYDAGWVESATVRATARRRAGSRAAALAADDDEGWGAPASPTVPVARAAEALAQPVEPRRARGREALRRHRRAQISSPSPRGHFRPSRRRRG